MHRACTASALLGLARPPRSWPGPKRSQQGCSSLCRSCHRQRAWCASFKPHQRQHMHSTHPPPSDATTPCLVGLCSPPLPLPLPLPSPHLHPPQKRARPPVPRQAMLPCPHTIRGHRATPAAMTGLQQQQQQQQQQLLLRTEQSHPDLCRCTQATQGAQGHKWHTHLDVGHVARQAREGAAAATGGAHQNHVALQRSPAECATCAVSRAVCVCVRALQPVRALWTVLCACIAARPVRLVHRGLPCAR